MLVLFFFTVYIVGRTRILMECQSVSSQRNHINYRGELIYVHQDVGEDIS